jgi:hypothetical protein
MQQVAAATMDALGEQFFEVTRALLASARPSDGSRLGVCLEFVIGFEHLPPERQQVLLDLGRMHLDGRRPWSNLSKRTLDAALSGASKTLEGVYAQARRRRESRGTPTGREGRRTIVARLHAARALAELADTQVRGPTSDQVARDIMVRASALILLQEATRPEIATLIRGVAEREVENATRRWHLSAAAQEDVVSQAVLDYLTDPPDYLRVDLGATTPEVWAYLLKVIRNKMRNAAEALSSTQGPRPRTNRKHGANGGVPSAPLGASRSAAAVELREDPKTLKRLEESGDVTPLRDERGRAWYRASDIARAEQVLRIRRGPAGLINLELRRKGGP